MRAQNSLPKGSLQLQPRTRTCTQVLWLRSGSKSSVAFKSGTKHSVDRSAYLTWVALQFVIYPIYPSKSLHGLPYNQLLPIEIYVVDCAQNPLLQKCAAWSSILWNQRHLAAQQQQSRIKPSSCAKPCFRSCSWEHTSLEHAQLPRQKPRSSSCLFIFLSLEFLKCKPNLSESGFGESRKSTLPSGGDMRCQTPPWKNPVVGGSSRIEAPRRNFKVHLAWSPRWETLPEFTFLARRLDKPRINWATGNVERMMFDTGRV